MLPSSYLKITTHNDAPLRLHSLREPSQANWDLDPNPTGKGDIPTAMRVKSSVITLNLLVFY